MWGETSREHVSAPQRQEHRPGDPVWPVRCLQTPVFPAHNSSRAPASSTTAQGPPRGHGHSWDWDAAAVKDTFRKTTALPEELLFAPKLGVQTPRPGVGPPGLALAHGPAQVPGGLAPRGWGG